MTPFFFARFARKFPSFFRQKMRVLPISFRVLRAQNRAFSRFRPGMLFLFNFSGALCDGNVQFFDVFRPKYGFPHFRVLHAEEIVYLHVVLLVFFCPCFFAFVLLYFLLCALF